VDPSRAYSTTVHQSGYELIPRRFYGPKGASMGRGLVSSTRLRKFAPLGLLWPSGPYASGPRSLPPVVLCAKSPTCGKVQYQRFLGHLSQVLTMDDQIFDAYTLTDSAQVVRITMLQNLTLSDSSITTQAPSSTLRVGFTHFRFIENLQIARMEVHHAYFSGIHVQSIRNSAISDCYIHHISDIVPLNPGCTGLAWLLIRWYRQSA
jgi:hypothetical protein